MKSDWSNSNYGIDNQVRKRPVRHDVSSDWETETEDQETIVETPLRRPNTMPKVLTCGKEKFPLANWTSVTNRQGHNSQIDGHDTVSTSFPRRDPNAKKNLMVMVSINKSQTYSLASLEKNW